MASIEVKSMNSPLGNVDSFLEDPFDGDIDLTFPPMRYPPIHYPNPTQKKMTTRRESSRERARLYKELVGHEPYEPTYKVPEDTDIFWVTLDIKHYKPEEVTLKVDGKKILWFYSLSAGESIRSFQNMLEGSFRHRFSPYSWWDYHSWQYCR